MAEAARDLYGRRLDEPRMQEFIKNFAAYRLDEILGDWKPYADVIHNALERACKRNGVVFSAEDASMVYERVPTWGPHADVPAGLAKVVGFAQPWPNSAVGAAPSATSTPSGQPAS